MEDVLGGVPTAHVRGVLMAILAPMLVERTERGDEMFMTMLARHARHVLELDAEELLPDARGAPAPPLRPSAGDEGRHEPGPEPLWNESWYFDAIAADGSVGAWVRVGLYPNLGVCWYTALVCGPDRATVAVDRLRRATAGRRRALGGDRGAARRAPLRAGARALRARAGGARRGPRRSVGDLARRAGREERLALDLSWQTAGDPYAYRLTTRYEIPCTVSGHDPHRR